MDFSKRYIQMCSTAHPLQTAKWNTGFAEGDFVWVEKDSLVRVVGNDFLHLNTLDQHEKDKGIFKFAVRKDKVSMIETDATLYEVKQTDITGLYITDVIENPIWLPRLDQLVNILALKTYFINYRDVTAIFETYFYHCAIYYIPDSSLEVSLLMYIMERIYNCYWDTNYWRINDF